MIARWYWEKTGAGRQNLPGPCSSSCAYCQRLMQLDSNAALQVHKQTTFDSFKPQPSPVNAIDSVIPVNGVAGKRGKVSRHGMLFAKSSFLDSIAHNAGARRCCTPPPPSPPLTATPSLSGFPILIHCFSSKDIYSTILASKQVQPAQSGGGWWMLINGCNVALQHGSPSQTWRQVGSEHRHLCFLSFPSAMVVGEGLPSCHSATSRGCLATDLQRNQLHLSYQAIDR